MLKWVFGADTSPFRRSLNEMRNDVKQFSASAGGQLAGIFGGAALLAGASKIIKEFARIKDLADRFGQSSESIQRVGAAASQAGTDIEGVAKGMTKATVSAVEAANGNDELSAAFERMGVNAAEFANMPIENQLLAMAKGYDESSSKAQGLSDVMKIMGKSGAEAIPLLTQGYEELKAAMAGIKTAPAGVVNTLAALDDRLEEGKQTVSVWAAWLISAVTSITTSWALAWGGIFDIIGDGFNMVVTLSKSAMKVVSATLTGDFAGAKEASKEYFHGIKGGFSNMVNDAEKAAGAIASTWKDNMGGDADAKGTAKQEIENAKAAAEAKIAAAKEQMDLAKQIADLEEKARENQLSLTEKILDAEKQRAALVAQMNSGSSDDDLTAKRDVLQLDAKLAELHKQDAAARLQNEEKIGAAHKAWNTLALENKRSGMSDDDKIKSLREEQKVINEKARAAKAKGDEVNAVGLGKESWGLEDRIKGLQAGIDAAKAGAGDAEKAQAFKGMSDQDKVKSLAADRDKARAESDAAFKAGDTKTGFEKKTKAIELGGQVDDLKKDQSEKKQSEIDEMKALDAKGGTIKTSYLADVGGGGGAFMNKVDHTQQIAQGVQELVSIARQGLDQGKPGPPEAI